MLSISSAVTAANNTHVVYVADAQRHGVYQVELFVNEGEKRLPLNFDVPVAVAHDVTSGNVYITERGRDSVRSRKYIYKWDQGRQQTAKVELPRCRYFQYQRDVSCIISRSRITYHAPRGGLGWGLLMELPGGEWVLSSPC